MDLFGAASSLLGGVSSLIGGNAASAGSKAAAKAYGVAAGYADQNAQLALENEALAQKGTEITKLGFTRQLYQVMGGARADVAASGLAQSGSAEDVMRSTAQQGALTKSLITLQGDIAAKGYEAESLSYKAQAASYAGQAQAATAQAGAQKSGGTLGLIGGIIGGIASIFSDDRLKENIELLHRRDDGLGIYRFRYAGIYYEGALASDVERIYPEAVRVNDNGFKMVDYDAIGVELRIAGSIV
jgi:hypothetical protein